MKSSSKSSISKLSGSGEICQTDGEKKKINKILTVQTQDRINWQHQNWKACCQINLRTLYNTHFFSLQEVSDIRILKKWRMSHYPLQVPATSTGGSNRREEKINDRGEVEGGGGRTTSAVINHSSKSDYCILWICLCLLNMFFLKKKHCWETTTL